MPQPSPIFGSAPTAPRWSRFFRIARPCSTMAWRLAVLHVGDEADAAGILLACGIVEALRGRQGRVARPPMAVRRRAARFGLLSTRRSSRPRIRSNTPSRRSRPPARSPNRPAGRPLSKLLEAWESRRERPHLAGVSRLASAEQRPFRPRAAGGFVGSRFGRRPTRHDILDDDGAALPSRSRWDSITVLTAGRCQNSPAHARGLCAGSDENFPRGARRATNDPASR